MNDRPPGCFSFSMRQRFDRFASLKFKNALKGYDLMLWACFDNLSKVSVVYLSPCAGRAPSKTLRDIFNGKASLRFWPFGYTLSNDSANVFLQIEIQFNRLLSNNHFEIKRNHGGNKRQKQNAKGPFKDSFDVLFHCFPLTFCYESI